MWDALRLDVRHSVRSLRRAPTFSLIVIVTLTLAVGATAAVGSLLNALVLRPLAVPSPEQLVTLSALEPRANVEGYFYADTLKAYRATQRSLAQMSMYAGGGIRRVETRSGTFDAETEAVSPSYFDLVSVRPSAGRFFSESDDDGIVIREGFRRQIFGDGPGVGEAVKVNGVPATVIGVAPDGFNGLQSDGAVDIVVPFALPRSAGDDVSGPLRTKTVVGRRAGGVPIDGGRAELLARWPSIQAATLPAALREADREALLRQRLTVTPLASGLFGSARPVRHHALGAAGPDGNAPGGRVRQPGGPHPGALADAAAPGRDSSRAGRKRSARVLATAGRRDPAVDRGVRGCASARVGDGPSRDGGTPHQPQDFRGSDGDV